MKIRNVILMTAVVAALACARDLEPDLGTTSDSVLVDGAGGAGEPIEVGEEGFTVPARSGNFVHELSSDGSVITTVVDATNHDDWQFLDLDSGESSEVGWDLRFRRFFVLTNGGVTGDGGVQVARLDGVPFADVEEAPEDGWTIDQSDGESDTDSEPDNVFNNGDEDWYDYEISDHTLTPKDATFVISSDEEKFYKFRILDYYDPAGTPAVVKFQWAPLPGEEIEEQDLPDEPSTGGNPDHPGQVDVPDDAITVDASSREEWVYLSVDEGLIDIADHESSTKWDLRFQRTMVLTNGGSSGPGVGGARLSDDDYEDVRETTSCGFSTDVLQTSPIPGAQPTSSNEVLGEWYDLDEDTNRVNPGERTYVIRLARGGYAKLRVWTWDDGVFRLSLERIDEDLSPAVLDVRSPLAGEWRYISLSDCSLVDVAVPTAELRWDVAISAAKFQTNSGTSGSGEGGVLKVDAVSLSAPMSLPGGEFIVDEANGEDSSNAVLDDWFTEIDSNLMPKDEVYWVRTATGDYGLLEVEGHSAGTTTLKIAYAGPGSDAWGEAPQ